MPLSKNITSLGRFGGCDMQYFAFIQITGQRCQLGREKDSINILFNSSDLHRSPVKAGRQSMKIVLISL